MARTAEEEVLFRIMSEDEDGAKELLGKFLPGELEELATAARTMLDLIREAYAQRLRSDEAELEQLRRDYVVNGSD